MLPKMEIRKFSIEPKKWHIFIDSFNSTVHALTALSNIQKFNQLQVYLEGEALTSISRIALISQNYTQAIDLLRKRYGNPQIIISSHINTLVKFSAASENDEVFKLRILFDDVNSCIRSLCL